MEFNPFHDNPPEKGRCRSPELHGPNSYPPSMHMLDEPKSLYIRTTLVYSEDDTEKEEVM